MMYGKKPEACAAFLTMWEKLGKANPWIRASWDPEFTAESFAECSVEELFKAFQHGNWCLGAAFCIEWEGHYFAFINQVNGGDEWLTIRGGLSFESVTARLCFPTVEALRNQLDRWVAVSDERLRRLEF